jgi:hypothetical protein
MNQVLNSFTIKDLLRNLFSGIFFVVSFVCFTCKKDLFEIFNNQTLFTIAVPFSLFIGVVIYSLHRSLFYPWLEYLFDSRFGKKLRNRMPLLSTSSFEIIIWRWGQEKFPTEISINKVNENLNKWADYIHFQYSSSICTFCGIFLGSLSNHCRNPHSWLLIFIGFLLFFAALVSDWRLHSLIDYIKKANS